MNENQPINLTDAFQQITEPWVPKIAGALNGQFVKLAKFDGEFIWHHHADEDELFLVIEGSIDLHFRERTVHVPAGSFYIVPRGVEHKPVAREPACVLLFEPQATRNTGAVDDARSIEPGSLDRLDGSG